MSDSMRDDLNAALDEAAEKDETQNYDETAQEILSDEPTDETTTDETQDAESPTDTDGTETEKVDGSVAPTDSKTGETSESADKTDGVSPLSGDSIKAPVNWGPKEREAWSKVPRNLQENIVKREKEVNTLMQTTAEARKTHEQMGQLTNQYGLALSDFGNNATEAASNLFSTVASLKMGSPMQKAQIVADMINTFGVDINTLDSAIVGAAPTQQSQQNSDLERMLSERMAPFEAQMGQQKAYEAQQATQRQDTANSEVVAFQQNAEFLNDVRHDMADMIDMAAKRGVDMTLEDAYSKACAINPQISAVMAERAQRATLTGSNDSMTAKRNAASSVSGNRTGVGSVGNMSMHDTISAAWDNAGKI